MRRDMWKDREATSHPEEDEEGKRVPLSRQQLVTRDPRLTVSWNRVCGYQTRLYYTNAYAGIIDSYIIAYQISTIFLFFFLFVSLLLSWRISREISVGASMCYIADYSITSCGRLFLISIHFLQFLLRMKLVVLSNNKINFLLELFKIVRGW